jgi:hypothetical protein
MIWQEREMIGSDWLGIYNIAMRKRACTKVHKKIPTSVTPLINPL